MRLTRRFVLAIIATLATITAVNSYLRYQLATSRFAARAEREHAFVGRTLAAAYAALRERDGDARAREIMRLADSAYPSIRVRVVRLSPDAPPDERPSERRVGLLDLVTRGRPLRLAEPGRFVSWFPIASPPGPPLAVEVSEPLSTLRDFAHDQAVRNVLVGLVMILLGSLCVAMLGVRFVGAPLSLLVEKARRVGAGDLSGPLTLRQADEIGDLAREMNVMAERLATSRAAFESEAAMRVQAVEQLRHADRLRTVGQLAAGIAHELGTPLAIVRGHAQLVAAGTSPLREADVARLTMAQCDRMSALVRQLLDFSRQGRAVKAPESLGALAERAVEMLHPFARSRGVALRWRPSAGDVPVEVDASQIVQVATNLVVNAVQASTSGAEVTVGVDVARATPPPDVGGPEGDYGRLEVRDRGAGIAATDLSRIFEPFFTTKPVGEGTGLGLSVAYAIAREHEGWIEARSAPGEGSSFSVFLPLRGGDQRSLAFALRHVEA